MEPHAVAVRNWKTELRKGRAICVQGYLREYRKDDSDSSPYRAIVANDFTTRKDRQVSAKNPAKQQLLDTRKLIRFQTTKPETIMEAYIQFDLSYTP